MKKLLSLLSLSIVIFLNGCQEDKITCKIVSPTDGKSVSANKELAVVVEATSTKGSVTKVTIFFDEASYNSNATVFEIVAPPYIVPIPAQLVTLGKHTIKAVAINKKGLQAETSVSINVVENTGNDGKESPDFVTFTDGKLPAGWITYTWASANIGFDDNYSMRSAHYPATIYATKTFNAPGYVQFYTKGGTVDLYIDNEKAQALVFESGNWDKWIYSVDAGKHEFRWQAEGIDKYLDAITFSKKR
jgi:hypothetical protein